MPLRKTTALLLGALAAVPPAAAEAPADPTAERAVRAFADICLANAGGIGRARAAALAAPWSFERQGDLPSLTRGAPMQTFVSGDVELLLRPEKKGFGCLILFKMGSAMTNEQLRDAISRSPGLTLASPGGGKLFRAAWRSSTAPQGSEVQLTVYNTTPRAPILALESKGTSN